MATPVRSTLDFESRPGITNLAAATSAGQPVVFEQLNAAIEGLSWKDNVRVASVANVTVAAPGAAIDGITLANGDRMLLKSQTTATENGIYVFNGSATPATRALDANTFGELESAVVTVDEGTNAGSTWRQTQVNGVVGTNDVVWASFGTSSPAASETVSGIAEIATQAETDAGTDDARIVTPAKAKNASWMLRRFAVTIGDNAATSISVTHNLNNTDVIVQVFEIGGSKRQVLVEAQITSANAITLLFDVAPALNSLRAVVLA